MHTLLIILIVYGSLGLITSSIPTSTIDLDSAEINKLATDIRRTSPVVVRRVTESVCQMISQCCSQAKSTFISMILSGEMQGLTEQCFGEKSSFSFLSKVLSCSPLVTVTTLATNPQLAKYLLIIGKKSDAHKNLLNIMHEGCSEKETYSIACEWDNSDQHGSCQRKILQILAEKGDDKAYKDQIQQTKDMYIQLNDELKKEFSN